MINFIVDNLGTIVVSMILLAAVALDIRKLYKDKKAGRSACGCKCADCPNASMCRNSKDT